VLVRRLREQVRSLPSRVEIVQLGSNDIDARGAITLAAALRGKSQLTDLAVEFNPIGDEGAAAVGAALKENQQLTFIDFGGCSLSSEGVADIAISLRDNRELSIFRVGANQIGDAGAFAVASNLVNKPNMLELNFVNSYIKSVLSCSGVLLLSPFLFLFSLSLSLSPPPTPRSHPVTVLDMFDYFSSCVFITVAGRSSCTGRCNGDDADALTCQFWDKRHWDKRGNRFGEFSCR
jgi:hypothetical protein